MKKWVFILSLLVASAAEAGPRERAYRLHNRLTGVPPSPELLEQLTVLLQAGQEKAALLLIQQNPLFLSVVVKGFASPWTNAAENSKVPLNDYSATIIGMVRDQIPFDQVLYGDFIYTGMVAPTNSAGTALPPYSTTNNDHYIALENSRAVLRDVLVKKSQAELQPGVAPAGVMTTRAWGEAYYSAGTNRRALRFALKTYLCKDMEDLSDVTRPDFRVRQDVTRNPGGETVVYKTKCAGCHSGMDALGGAFAHYDFVNGAVAYTPDTVAGKYSINIGEFPDGYVTTDDTWLNLWTKGSSSAIQWQGDLSGRGAASLGKSLTKTDLFPKCVAAKTFKYVCLRDPNRDEAAAMTDKFKASNYNLKALFGEAALTCSGE